MIKKVPSHFKIGTFSILENNQEHFVQVLYPLPCFDVIEIIEVNQNVDSYQLFGFANESQQETIRSILQAIRTTRHVPALEIAVLKNFPTQDNFHSHRLFTLSILSLLNDKFDLDLEPKELDSLIKWQEKEFYLNESYPLLLSSKTGETERIDLNLNGLWVILHYTSTSGEDSFQKAIAEANSYQNKVQLIKTLQQDITVWKKERSSKTRNGVFENEQAIAEAQNKMETAGSSYTSVNHENSSVIGLFKERPSLQFEHGHTRTFQLK